MRSTSAVCLRAHGKSALGMQILTARAQSAGKCRGVSRTELLCQAFWKYGAIARSALQLSHGMCCSTSSSLRLKCWLGWIAGVGQGADLLSHEATFTADMREKAHIAQHSTAPMAGAFARALGAQTLVLTHFSGRFLDWRGKTGAVGSPFLHKPSRLLERFLDSF